MESFFLFAFFVKWKFLMTKKKIQRPFCEGPLDAKTFIFLGGEALRFNRCWEYTSHCLSSTWEQRSPHTHTGAQTHPHPHVHAQLPLGISIVLLFTSRVEQDRLGMKGPPLLLRSSNQATNQVVTPAKDILGKAESRPVPTVKKKHLLRSPHVPQPSRM